MAKGRGSPCFPLRIGDSSSRTGGTPFKAPRFGVAQSEDAADGAALIAESELALGAEGWAVYRLITMRT